MYWFCYSGNRLHNFVVDVSSEKLTAVNAPTSTRCMDYTGVATDGQVIALHCSVPTRGRWVKVQILDTAPEYLTLCEVEVFGIFGMFCFCSPTFDLQVIVQLIALCIPYPI
jgi:hypothetical protein